MKTPIQELIEWMEQNQYFIGNDLYDKQKELLEKEREVIETAHFEGGYYTNGSKSMAEQYYKETFKQ